ncbi:MAG: hypothetical protein KDA27_26250 [Candidatus Eisenbacteria bacterium]|uniref:Uncharacterized protein n=1 Tax=Eiseniibacteriota bacterium TaxID=2212470 RepID=A0A956SG04_UNCEI|nr:hypothetical protein [Candidatus Eisenbacteria bacterium]
MQFGRDSIKKCPGCGELFRIGTLLTGNTFGSVSWLDGFFIAPGMPDIPAVVRCSHCDAVFFHVDMKEMPAIPG